MGVFDGYQFTIIHENGEELHVLRQSDNQERKVRFESLLAGTMYPIKAITRSGEEKSDPITTYILTSKSSQM